MRWSSRKCEAYLTRRELLWIGRVLAWFIVGGALVLAVTR